MLLIHCRDGSLNMHDFKHLFLSEYIAEEAMKMELNLSDITKSEFNYINEYLIHMLEAHNLKPPVIARPLRTKPDLDEYEMKLFDSMSIDSALRYATISEYLRLSCFNDLCCAKIAYEMIGLKTMQLRQKFGIEDDFTNVEKLEIDDYFDWVSIFQK